MRLIVSKILIIAMIVFLFGLSEQVVRTKTTSAPKVSYRDAGDGGSTRENFVGKMALSTWQEPYYTTVMGADLREFKDVEFVIFKVKTIHNNSYGEPNIVERYISLKDLKKEVAQRQEVFNKWQELVNYDEKVKSECKKYSNDQIAAMKNIIDQDVIRSISNLPQRLIQEEAKKELVKEALDALQKKLEASDLEYKRQIEALKKQIDELKKRQ